jgi:hypothetical protein
MQNDQSPQFKSSDIARPVLGVLLWNAAIYLLGLPSTMPPGIGPKVGSVIVLTGCMLIARPMVGMVTFLFRPKSKPPAAPRSAVIPGTDVTAARPRTALFRRSGSRTNLGP